MSAWTRVTALLLFLACRPEPPKAADPNRPWGHRLEQQRLAGQARESLDPRRFGDDPQLRARILGLSFAEAEARLGPVRYEGSARFRLQRNGHDLNVVEHSVIESGPGGDVRVVQTDADDRLLREAIRVSDRWYVRKGQGDLHPADFVQRRNLRVHEEAYEALAAFMSAMGGRAAWKPQADRSVGGRPAVGFAAHLAGTGPPHQLFGASARAEELSGRLWLDAETGVPVNADLRGRLRLTDAESPGTLEASVELRVRPSSPKTFDVADARARPPRPEIDLDPLAFLERLTRTSTIIGGDEAPTE